jgi:hypothetical protein
MATSTEPQPKYPFVADKAWLGWAHRKPDLRYSFDGRRLVMWDVKLNRMLMIVGGALLGPGITLRSSRDASSRCPGTFWRC